MQADQTPMYWAVNNGVDQIVESLVCASADVNGVTKVGVILPCIRARFAALQLWVAYG